MKLVYNVDPTPNVKGMLNFPDGDMALRFMLSTYSKNGPARVVKREIENSTPYDIWTERMGVKLGSRP